MSNVVLTQRLISAVRGRNHKIRQTSLKIFTVKWWRVMSPRTEVLTNPLVLEKVFDHLPPADVKAASLVSR